MAKLTRKAKASKRKADKRRQAASSRARKAAPAAIEAALAGIAHDIRTPLTGIVALAELLASSDLGQREREWANAIKSGADHLAALSTLIVDAARADAAGLVLRHEPMSGPRAEAAGHLHPSAKVAARGRTVRRRCFVTDGERVVLPAFGAYAGGLNVRDTAFAGLFAGWPIAVTLGPQRSHAIAWSMLVSD